jgi:hypothetical protein
MKNICELLREGLTNIGSINEVDWESTFSDAKKKCMSHEEVADYLNKVVANVDKKTKDREKFDAGLPYVHAKSRLLSKGSDGVDVDEFIKRITKRPDNIITFNSKMEKTGKAHEYVYNTGIPAFRGVVYDIEAGKFYVLNTCPGAGSCVAICYARSGNYIRFSNSYDLMTRRINFMLNYPDKYAEQIYDELKAKCIEHKAFIGYKNKVILRWNDSGDFFSKKYVSIAKSVMDRLTEDGYNITSGVYTKVASVANDGSNFDDVVFSSGANKGETDKVDVYNSRNATVIPKALLKGLNLMKLSDEQTLKGRVVNHFKNKDGSQRFNIDDIITYDEMMDTNKSGSPRWHVIVTNQDGDDALHRPDVKTILLVQH